MRNVQDKEIWFCFKDVRAFLSVSLQFFETQECERINYFRNALWLHVNQLSQDCVQNDEVRQVKILIFLFGKQRQICFPVH